MPCVAHLLAFLPRPIDEAILSVKQGQAMISDVLFWSAASKAGRSFVWREHCLISDPAYTYKNYFRWLWSSFDHLNNKEN